MRHEPIAYYISSGQRLEVCAKRYILKLGFWEFGGSFEPICTGDVLYDRTSCKPCFSHPWIQLIEGGLIWPGESLFCVHRRLQLTRNANGSQRFLGKASQLAEVIIPSRLTGWQHAILTRLHYPARYQTLKSKTI